MVPLLFFCYMLHAIGYIERTGAENTAIGDGNDYCTKGDLLRVQMSVLNLSNRVAEQKNDFLEQKNDILDQKNIFVEQKNDIYEIKRLISAAGDNAQKTNVDDTIGSELIKGINEHLSAQDDTLNRLVERMDDLITSWVQLQNETLQRQTERIDDLERGLTSLVQLQTNAMNRQAERIGDLGRGLTSLVQQMNGSLFERIDDIRNGLTSLGQQPLNKSSCPDGYIKYQRSCYKFYEIERSWSDAIAYCKEHGSSLVVLDTTGEYQFLASYLKALRPNPFDYWIAASDADEEGVWTWEPSGLPAENLPWGDDQPNSYQGLNQDCVKFDNYLNFRLNDVGCRSKIRFVCEMNLFH